MGIFTDEEKDIIRKGDVDGTCSFILDCKGGGEEKCRKAKASIKRLLDQSIRDAKNLLLKFADAYAHKRARFLPNLIKELIEELKQNLTVVSTCASISMQRIAEFEDKKFLSIMFECLQRYPLDSITCMHVMEPEKGKKLMKILLEKKRDIALNLLQIKDRDVNSRTLDLIEKVANEIDPDFLLTAASKGVVGSTILDLIENCAHSEKWPLKGTQALKVARILNPLHPLKNKTVYIDTGYLMNWGRENHYFSNPGKTEIHRLIEEVSTRIIKGSGIRRNARKFIRQNQIIDLLMFLPEKRYRGHDIHHFNVATLGLLFLNIYVNNNTTLKEYIRLQYDWIDEADVEVAWLVASLLHDHALPIRYMFKLAPFVCDRIKDRESSERLKSYAEAVERIQKAMEDTYLPLFSDKLFNIYERFKGAYDDRLYALDDLASQELQKIKFPQVRKNILPEHGVLGAINILSRLGDVSNDETIKIALEAIAVHSADDKISFKNDPLNFLLVLCDELQEWGREIAFSLPEVLIEISSIQIKRLRSYKGNRLSFMPNLCVSFRFLAGNRKRTRFDAGLFMKGKKRLYKRLKWDDPNVYPQDIQFERPTYTKK